MESAQQRPKVLIVDDMPENIRMLIELLKDDYITIPAKSGEAAILKAQKAPQPDLILLDVLMPDMDGYEVCQKLKQEDATREIPVIFLTGLDEVDNEAKGFAEGAVDYVTKPFQPVTVKARVKSHIELSRTMKELQEALENVKILSGMLPICSHCKKIRDDEGYWNQLEVFIDKHSEAKFSHSICPDCAHKLYPDLDITEELLKK